ncbi:MAG: hypothetical protein ACFFDX_16400 [Candidatus Odinarchaeota archaeon]
MKEDIILILFFFLILNLFWLALLTFEFIINLNEKKVFIRTIKHELTHARIFEKFGFKNWKIKKINDKDYSMICTLTIPKNEINQKSFLKLFLLFSAQFIYDLGMPFLFLSIKSIIKNMREYFSEIKQLIICTIKK